MISWIKECWVVPAKNKIPVNYKNIQFSKWKTFNFNEYFDEQEYHELKKQQKGIAIWCIKSNILALDFDDPEIIKKFNEKIKEEKYTNILALINNTYIEKTNRGLHILFKVEDPQIWLKINEVKFDKVEILTDHLLTIHGFLEPEKIINNKEPTVISLENFELLIQCLKEITSFKQSNNEDHELIEIKDVREEIINDTEKIVNNLYGVLKEYYKEGARHLICLAISGVLRHCRYTEEQAKEIIEKLALKFNDNEIKDRIKTVETTYKQDIQNVAVLQHLLKAGIPEQKAIILKKQIENVIKCKLVMFSLKMFMKSDFIFYPLEKTLKIVLSNKDTIVVKSPIVIKNDKVKFDVNKFINALYLNGYFPSKGLRKFLRSKTAPKIILYKAKIEKPEETDIKTELYESTLIDCISKEQVTEEHIFFRKPIYDPSRRVIYYFGRYLKDICLRLNISEHFSKYLPLKRTKISINGKIYNVYKLHITYFENWYDLEQIILKRQKDNENIEGGNNEDNTN